MACWRKGWFSRRLNQNRIPEMNFFWCSLVEIFTPSPLLNSHRSVSEEGVDAKNITVGRHRSH